jgi:hypothetical protein
MIRFRTIDPETTEPAKAAAPAVETPRPAPVSVEPAAAADNAKAKGLTRKTPLRAKKRDAAPLFDDKAPAAEGSGSA